jgi:uncharacterized membrane protein YbhN (UPF0104 family)
VTERRFGWRNIVRGTVSVAIVVGIFVGVFPRIANYSDVWATIRDFTWLEVTTLVVVGIWNVVTYWFVMVAVLPGLTYPQAAVVNQASTAVSNTLPGGGAIGVAVSYAMYTSWGFSKAEFAEATVVSGVWNNFVKLGLPVVALGLLAITDEVNPALAVAGLIGVAVLIGAIVLFALMLRSGNLAKRIGEAIGKAVTSVRAHFGKTPVSGWGDATAGFFKKTARLVHDRWLRITIAAVISHLSLFVVLLLSLRHVGIAEVEVSWVRILAAYAFVRLISALPITPGGVGVVELGYTAALGIGLGDAAQTQIVAAVLVFRFVTFVLPIPAGAISYVFWRRNRSWKRNPETG